MIGGFLRFLRQTEILADWQTLPLAAVRHIFLPPLFFVLLYGVRVLYGITSTNALPTLLFSNVAVMTLLGFTAVQVATGLTQRGASQRTGRHAYCLMDPQTVASTLCKASLTALERLFNGAIHRLAAFGVFMGEVMVALVQQAQANLAPHSRIHGLFRGTYRAE